MTQFDGDDSNSTDLVLDLKVEVDGQWGPYLFCNPKNVSAPVGEWGCVARLNFTHPQPAGYPAQCSASHFDGYTGMCWTGEKAKVVKGVEPGDCCAEAAKLKLPDWTYYKSNKSCVVWQNASNDKIIYDKGCLSGDYEAPEPPPCDCPRYTETLLHEYHADRFEC